MRMVRRMRRAMVGMRGRSMVVLPRVVVVQERDRRRLGNKIKVIPPLVPTDIGGGSAADACSCRLGSLSSHVVVAASAEGKRLRGLDKAITPDLQSIMTHH